jgi:hypothetical protein
MFPVMMVKHGSLLNYINLLLKEIIVKSGVGVFGPPLYLQKEMLELSVEQVNKHTSLKFYPYVNISY